MHAYHDGALAPAAKAAVESHLQSCGDCRELLADLRGLTDTLATISLPDMPARAMSRMYGAFWAARRAKDHAVRRFAGWMTAAAAAVLVLVSIQQTPAIPSPMNANIAAPETLAYIPSAQLHEGPNAEFIEVAQWLANDLAFDQGQ
jgi:anti-sigma factor RsiW